jgi:hypothetical protein
MDLGRRGKVGVRLRHQRGGGLAALDDQVDAEGELEYGDWERGENGQGRHVDADADPATWQREMEPGPAADPGELQARFPGIDPAVLGEYVNYDGEARRNYPAKTAALHTASGELWVWGKAVDGAGIRRAACPVRGLMEALNPREDESDGDHSSSVSGRFRWDSTVRRST